MNVTDLYWIGAGVLALIVIVLLILWNVNQIQKQTERRRLQTTDGSRAVVSPETAAVDSPQPTKGVDMAVSQLESGIPTADAQPDVESVVPQAMMRPGLVNELALERQEPVAQLAEGTGQSDADEEIIIVPQSVDRAKSPQADGHAIVDDAPVAQLASGRVHDEGQALRARIADEFHHADFAELSAPLVLGQEDIDVADEILDEDHILRRAAYEAFAERVSHAGGFPEALRQRLEDPRVLGWLTVHPDGYVLASDQPYDDSVIDMFATLAGHAARTAEVVGLTETREFMVRGVEGMITMVPVSRIIADREGFLVIFLDGETTYEELLAPLGAAQ